MNYKKLIATLLITTLLFGRAVPFVLAEESPTTPETTTEAVVEAPQEPVNTPAPVVEPVAVITPIAPIAPIFGDKPPKADKPNKGTEPIKPIEPNAPSTKTEDAPFNTTNTEADNKDQTPISGNVGDTNIETGNANSNGDISNTGNKNSAVIGCSDCQTGSGGSGASIVNSGNGTDSANSGSANIVGNNNTNQSNGAVIINNNNQDAKTGSNNSSGNVGNTNITTGDANASGTLLTSVNTNVDGIAVSEFNIADDHTGDFVLDFGANCISGCSNLNGTNVANIGNGAGSYNDGSINNISGDTTNQNNSGAIENNVDFYANSGSNTSNKNTNGDTNITTGDANVAANIINFLNNNIAGNVAYGVVNIFGNLVGDIILPDNVFDQFACSTCAGGNTNVGNIGNGADSLNSGTVNNTNTDNTFQTNNADIANNLTLNGETGENEASKNTGGDINITTGETNLRADVLNIANMNLAGENMWLVFINDAGRWVGQLFGADVNGKMAGSPNAQFAVDPDGTINVINSKNGAESQNQGVVNNTSENNLNQSNDAKIVNNVNLSALTGNNEASKNTGGDINITTGDAQAIANIVNFVNNNITGGKLLVTFVNVFGTWTGDFLTPGSHKAPENVVVQSNGSTSNSNSSNKSNTTTSKVAGASAYNEGLSNSGLIAAVGFSGGSSDASTSISNDGDQVKVAGVNNLGLVADIQNDQKTMNINLAWLILALPLLAVGILARKKYLKKSVRNV